MAGAGLEGVRNGSEDAVANKDRMTFEEAAKELQISEDELEQLVANGEIASIKEGDTLFFKPEVVSQFKKSRKTEPTIILADEDMEILDVMEEIDLETKESPAQAAAGAPAGAGGASDLLNLDDLELPDLESREAGAQEVGKAAAPAPAPAAPEDTVLNLEGLLEDDGSEGTTPIPGGGPASQLLDEPGDVTVEGNVSDDTLLDTDLLELGEEEDSFKLDAAAEETLTEPTEATLLRGGGARVMQMKRKKSHAAITAVLALTAITLFVPLGVHLNTLSVSMLAGESASLPDKSKQSVYQWVIDSSQIVGDWWVLKIADLFG
jgi:excisionase family DNA binding protein